jgi:hypothetical protein
MRKLINVSEQVIESYKKYFIRNSGKWISRNNLSIDNLEKEFTIDGKTLLLRGQITDREYIMEDGGNGDFYKVEIDRFQDQIDKKLSK